MIYVIGSLRSARPREIAALLRQDGHEVFDDWQAPGPQADDFWREYEQRRGRTFAEALAGAAAQNVFQFDKGNLDRAETAVLVMPAGKSAHLELGYVLGCGKPGYILLDGEPERWDVMYGFATGVFTDVEALRSALGACVGPLRVRTPSTSTNTASRGSDVREATRPVPCEEAGTGSLYPCTNPTNRFHPWAGC